MPGILVLTFLIFVFFSSAALPMEAAEIHIVSAEWEGYTNADGSGAYWEVVKAVFEPLGFVVKTTVAPWQRAVYLTDRKRFDALLGEYYRPEKNHKELVFPSWHISKEDPIIVIIRNEDAVKWKARGKTFLVGKNIAWIRGYGFRKSILNDVAEVKFHALTELYSGLLMLQKHRIDALVDYDDTLVKAANVKAANRHKINLEANFHRVQLHPGRKLYLAFSNSERSIKLTRIFDERMQLLAASGEIEKIYLKWGFDKSKFPKETK